MAAGAMVLARPLTAQSIPIADDSLWAAVDGWVARGLLRYEVAGAALAIVRGGKIVHRRGFGLADIGRRYPVDPDTTVFHIASVTKLITAIAALQQVEAGRLDLSGNVRPLLGRFTSAGWDRYPVTLHHLLTHTAGIDTRWIGMATHNPERVRPLAEYLSTAMPPIIDRPGTVIRYSNHGYAAVGRLVEVASGQPWADYVEQRVFLPLGMRRSYAHARTPTTSDAIPYRYRADTTPEPNVFEHAAPGGAVRSTATDLALLLAAVLDTASSTPLSAHGKTLLLVPQNRVGSGVAGYAYGTFEYPNTRVHAASAGGEVPGFSTRLLIVPALRLGVVLMVNRKDPTLAVSVFDSLLARVEPEAKGIASCAAGDSHVDSSDIAVAGQYRSNVYERESFLRVGALVGPMLTVSRGTAGSVVVVNPVDNTAGRWQRIGDSSWVGRSGACLTRLDSGRPAMVAMSTKFAGPVMLERAGVFSNPAVVLLAMVAALLALVGAAIGESWRWIKGRDPGSRGARWLIVAVPIAHFVSLVAFAVGLYRLAIGYDDRFAFGIPAWFTAALVIPHLVLIMTVVLGYLLLRDGRIKGVSRWRGWSAVAASSTMLIVLWSWRAVWLG